MALEFTQYLFGFYSILIWILLNFRRKGNTFFADMQENGDFFAIFSLEDARVASYRLRAPQNAMSVFLSRIRSNDYFGDPAG